MSTKPELSAFDWNAPASLGDLLNCVLEIQHFPDALARVLKQVNEENRNQSYREGGWTITQIIHHLADAHLNAFIRTKHMLAQDALNIQPFDQDKWASAPDAGFPIEASVVLLLGVHQRWSLLLLECLKKPAEYLVLSLHHPESKRTVYLSDIIRLYAWHGRHHLAQIEQAISNKQ